MVMQGHLQRIEAYNANTGYRTLLNYIANRGTEVTGQFGPSTELLDVRYLCRMGDMPQRRGQNPALGWTLMLQTIAGTYTPAVIDRVAPLHATDVTRFHMWNALGPRIAPQMPLLLDELRSDEQTRRAVLYVGSASDHVSQSSDVDTMQFVIRRGQLDLLVSMRACDVLATLPYYVIMFGGLGLAVCRAVRRPPGTITVRASTAFFYRRDQSKWPSETLPSDRFVFDTRVPLEWWSNIAKWAETVNELLEPNTLPVGVTLIGEA